MAVAIALTAVVLALAAVGIAWDKKQSKKLRPPLLAGRQTASRRVGLQGLAIGLTLLVLVLIVTALVK